MLWLKIKQRLIKSSSDGKKGCGTQGKKHFELRISNCENLRIGATATVGAPSSRERLFVGMLEYSSTEVLVEKQTLTNSRVNGRPLYHRMLTGKRFSAGQLLLGNI